MSSRSLMVMALVVALASCRKEPPPEPPAQRSTPTGTLHVDASLFASGRIQSVAVERRAPASELRVAGEARAGALAAAEVGALVAGRIATIEAAEGAHVERGQVLAWVDAPEAARATADVLRARARAEAAARKLARQLQLEAQEATSKNAIDDARTDDQVARADLVAARTLLRSLGGSEPPQGATDVSARVAIRAPVRGLVSRREAMLGGVVAPDKTLFWIASGERPIVLARVPETAAAPIDGERAALRVRASDTTCSGTVRGRLGVVDETSRTATVRIEPDAACGTLPAGAYVDVTFRRADGTKSAALVIPRDAVVDVRGVPTAFVADAKTGDVSVRPLRVREVPGPDVVIEAGLDEGEWVVREGAVLLKGELLRADLAGS